MPCSMLGSALAFYPGIRSTNQFADLFKAQAHFRRRRISLRLSLLAPEGSPLDPLRSE